MTVYTCVNMRLYVYVDVYEYIMCDLSICMLKLCVDINTLYRYKDPKQFPRRIYRHYTPCTRGVHATGG